MYVLSSDYGGGDDVDVSDSEVFLSCSLALLGMGGETDDCQV